MRIRMNSEEAILCNLQDAGCNPETITAFLEEWKAGKTTDALKLLATHRRSLLEEIHKGQKQIDCLDYLVYQMEKQACM